MQPNFVCLVTKSCLTLSDPMDCSLPGSSIHGIFRATVLEWGAIAFSQSTVQYVTNQSMGFPAGLVVKNISGLERSPGKGNDNPLQYSCPENPMDGGAWWAAVHEVAKSQTRLNDFTLTFRASCLRRVY